MLEFAGGGLAWISIPIAALFGYLLGSLPVGILVCRAYGVDIRTVGSGRTGTTNAYRAAGIKAAIPTLLGDALKGAIAVWIMRYTHNVWLFPDPSIMSVDEANTRRIIADLVISLSGGMAIIGHNWPVFNGFKGGAGGITGAATTMAISPLVGGIVWLIGAFLMWWSRISSVATFSVGLSAFVLFLILGMNQLSPWPYAVYGVIALVSVLVALQPNREKLRKGEERVNTLW
ncbi:MAG: glycerol-3-phosphate acyltransferase [Chloroflexota bacterium]